MKRVGIFVFGLVFCLSLVLAAHVVLTSSGGSSYSVNETVQNLFNISLNNSDVGQVANITSVNITIPSNFTFTAGTNGTSVVGSGGFSNTSTVLSWSNDTYLVNGSEVVYFWFNATALPGAYNITVTSVNVTGSYDTNISVEVNDTTVPVATAVCSPASVNVGGIITCSCSGTDVGLGINSSLTTADYSVDTSSVGSGVYNCSITDNGGNSANATATYTITTDNADTSTNIAGSTSSVTTSFWKSTYIAKDSEFENSFTREYSIKNRVKLKVGDDYHYVGVVGLTATTATINVSFETVQEVFSVGDEKKFDVDVDGYYDLKVVLNSISNSKANVTIGSINELVEVEKVEVVADNESGDVVSMSPEEVFEKSGNWFWIIGIVLVVLIVAVLVYFYWKRKV